MNGTNLKEGQWENMKQWSLGFGQRRKSFKTGDDDDDDDEYLFNCNWAVTRWQWLVYMYTKYEIYYY
jgi:hypothetical protein